MATHDLVAAVDGFAPPDSKVRVDDLLEQGGGPAATAAVAIARLGGRVALVSAVGADHRGEQILAELAAEGVDVSGCVRPAGSRSPVSMVTVERVTGSRNIHNYTGTASLAPSDVDPEVVAAAGLLLVDANLPEAAAAACRAARRAGVPVVLDAGEPKAGVEDLVALADYPVPPIGAARWLTGESEPERAALALLRGPARAVVVTMGTDGYVVASAEGVWREPAFRVEVVDTTGAGDAFHGGFAFSLARGTPAREAARFGAAVAALKCRRPGGRTGLPSLAEVEALLGRTD
jgi:sugar/nucleoside kinase (ribokinase family)